VLLSTNWRSIKGKENLVIAVEKGIGKENIKQRNGREMKMRQ